MMRKVVIILSLLVHITSAMRMIYHVYCSRLENEYSLGLEEKISILPLTFWLVKIILAGYWMMIVDELRVYNRELHRRERNSITERLSPKRWLVRSDCCARLPTCKSCGWGSSTASQWHKLFNVSLFENFFHWLLSFPFSHQFNDFPYYPPAQWLLLLATNSSSFPPPIQRLRETPSIRPTLKTQQKRVAEVY